MQEYECIEVTYYLVAKDIEEIEDDLKQLGFKIEKLIEGRNFAKYKNENPVVLRIVCIKSCL